MAFLCWRSWKYNRLVLFTGDNNVHERNGRDDDDRGCLWWCVRRETGPGLSSENRMEKRYINVFFAPSSTLWSDDSSICLILNADMEWVCLFWFYELTDVCFNSNLIVCLLRFYCSGLRLMYKETGWCCNVCNYVFCVQTDRHTHTFSHTRT